jgi:recombination protein RecT
MAQTGLQKTVKGATPNSVSKMIKSQAIVNRFEDVIGKKAPQFLASVLSAVNGNSLLSNADPQSVMASAMVAASLNLDINPSLGFAAIVPYRDSKSGRTLGQFQIMTKGLVQLALRTGQYKSMNVTEIYKDEFKSLDIITGEAIIEPIADGDRAHGRSSNICGYVAFFELINGFRKTCYWSIEEIRNHGKKFSKSYAKGPWSTNFPAMAAKTVLKNTLSKWGVLSTQMQIAVSSDQGIKREIDGEIEYLDNPDEEPNVNPSVNPEENPPKPPQTPKKEVIKELPPDIEIGELSDEELLGEGGLDF